HAMSRTLTGLVRGRGGERIALRGLSVQAVARFLAGIAGREPDEGLATLVAQETEGNPFFITEVVLFVAEVARLLNADGQQVRAEEVSAWRITIPDSVRAMVGQHLDRLTAACNQLLAVAAVIGREFGLDVLQRAASSQPGVRASVASSAGMDRLLEL